MSPVSPIAVRGLLNGLTTAVRAVAVLTVGGCASVPDTVPQSRVEPVTEPDGIRLQQGGVPILYYRSRPAPDREPWRVHYLHPLHATNGDVLTEDAPADHPHQRGVFWAWRRVLVDGAIVADGWVGRQLTLEVMAPTAQRLDDGSAEIIAQARWVVPVDGRPTPIIEERSVFRVLPLNDGARRIELDVRLTALRPGVALAGTDDEKGYGGLSFRLRDASLLTLASGGRELRATQARMRTGQVVSFSWQSTSELAATRVSIACSVDGRPWTEWVLRQEPSMQNCAFPGQTPAQVPMDGGLRLRATVRIE
jgi:hypothetical protein